MSLINRTASANSTINYKLSTVSPLDPQGRFRSEAEKEL